MKTFKIRASATGQIMSGSMGLTEVQSAKLNELITRQTGAKAGLAGIKPLTDNMTAELNDLIKKRDNPQLPAGAKTYCQTWVKQNIYERRKEFSSKYTDKGNWVEEHSLGLISKHLNMPGITKCDEFFENDFMRGNPDVLVAEFGIDAKNPWDCFTFPLFEEHLPDDDYYWQGQQYMALTGKSLWKFIYVLCDTPVHLIRNEARTYCYKNGVEMCPEIMDEFTARMTYGNIPDEYKIKVFDVKRNDSDIAKIEERVKACRTYIETLVIKKTNS